MAVRNSIFRGPVEDRMGVEPPHERRPNNTTYDRLRRMNFYTVVPWGYGAVDSRPMASFGYNYCRALVVKRGRVMGLSHIYACLDDYPEFYADKMLRLCSGRIDAAAVISRGDSSDLVDVCASRGIPVTDFELVPDGGPVDVIVVPSSGKIEVVTPASSRVLSLRHGRR